MGRRAATVTFAAAAILMVTMGARQSLGLFVSPLNTATGLGITTISFAYAVAQLMWGVAQPFAGGIADRHGPSKVLIGGMVVLAIGMALIPFMKTGLGLVFALGILAAIGAGAGSFSVLVVSASKHLTSESRGKSSGVINAGASFGQFVFAPITQALIQGIGWMGAMWSLAGITLATLPLVRIVDAPAAMPPGMSAAALAPAQPWRAVQDAVKDRSYLLLHAGFFTCGFHIAFLVTHLPGEVGLCGLPASVASVSLALIGLSNIVGSLLAGAGTARYRSKHILALMYGSRAVLIACYVAAPKTQWTFYLFAVGLGITWLATVPPTATIVGKLFGVRYLATLFGLALLSHQVGAFFGAYLGGLALAKTGNYQWMWYGDMALAAMAAIVNLPIREARVVPAAQPAAA